MRRLLITGAWRFDDFSIETLKRCGFDVVIMLDEASELPCPPQSINAVICNSLFLHHDISEFTSLELIQLTSAGFDRVPLDYIRQNGIVIYNAGTAYAIPMAEFAISAVLSLYKRIRFFEHNQQRAVWNKNRDVVELNGKTVCIIGCGNVGNETAKLFKAFGCKVIGVNRTLKKRFNYYDEVFSLNSVERALVVADVVVLSIALTDSTKMIINRQRLSYLRDGAVLVNVARGGLIDTSALLEELSNGRIYAALDVFDEEPLASDSLLWSLENVIITPHNSFVGDGVPIRLRSVILHNLREYYENLGDIS